MEHYAKCSIKAIGTTSENNADIAVISIEVEPVMMELKV